MLEARLHLIKGQIGPEFIHVNAKRYVQADHDRCHALAKCVGFIEGTVIGIATLKGYSTYQSAYNGHERKHALMVQALNSLDGLIAHVHGFIEGRRHDKTLYSRSRPDTHLPELLYVGGKWY